MGGSALRHPPPFLSPVRLRMIVFDIIPSEGTKPSLEEPELLFSPIQTLFLAF